jgi:hypothetical protein
VAGRLVDQAPMAAIRFPRSGRQRWEAQRLAVALVVGAGVAGDERGRFLRLSVDFYNLVLSLIGSAQVINLSYIGGVLAVADGDDMLFRRRVARG